MSIMIITLIAFVISVALFFIVFSITELFGLSYFLCDALIATLTVLGAVFMVVSTVCILLGIGL